MAHSTDPYNLQRFVEAQSGTYERALAELQQGRKRSHWMWFIFPQIDGLGMSSTARLYAIKSRVEARQYLAHPLLGPRLRTCAETVLRISERSAYDVFGTPDDLKLRSSMTLFAAVAPEDSVFAQVLERFFAGQPDERTLALLGT